MTDGAGSGPDRTSVFSYDDNYPPNDGAVRGSRVEYVNPQAFIRDYGDLVDRVGEPDGAFLELRPDGIPATWESRALPVTLLGDTRRQYRLSGHLPEGWAIEIHEIAPAFGQPGGGLRVLVKDIDRAFVPVSVLLSEGVVES